MGNRTIYISDCDMENISPEIKVFANNGFSYKWLNCRTEEDLINELEDATAVINQYAPMTEKVFKNLPKLKMIVRYGVGVDNIDVDAATKYGIQICNVPDYGTEEVADHAVALMMTLARKIYHSVPLVKKGIWDYSKSAPILRFNEMTVGIIGAGRIGKAFARMVHGMGCKILAYDAFLTQDDVPDYIKMVSQEDIFKKCDIISLHCFLNKETENLINSETLKMMKNTAFLINVARGGLVDEEALADAVATGKIAGAGLDVTKVEPMPQTHRFNSLDGILVTPHIAWYSESAFSDLKTKCAEEAVRFMKGEPVRCPVNKLNDSN